ncbi:hypothetical protein FIBSPDRAFT_581946 [Athelia psychrophila]|uniref:Uncharacterized protein n=1 Tax=Athelia psychrophila TaxID=1759441 RepID=A0A166ULZ7_9AGAM|nr:hypothetical protein FIBSPDRAFT_581946 [Fibularhizoctonia sp. CBS 109695]
MVNVLYRPRTCNNVHPSVIQYNQYCYLRLQFFILPFYFFAHTFVYFLASSSIVEYPLHLSLLDFFLVPKPDCLSLFSSPSYYSAFAFMCMYNMTPRRNNQYIMSETPGIGMFSRSSILLKSDHRCFVAPTCLQWIGPKYNRNKTMSVECRSSVKEASRPYENPE